MAKNPSRRIAFNGFLGVRALILALLGTLLLAGTAHASDTAPSEAPGAASSEPVQAPAETPEAVSAPTEAPKAASPEPVPVPAETPEVVSDQPVPAEAPKPVNPGPLPAETPKPVSPEPLPAEVPTATSSPEPTPAPPPEAPKAASPEPVPAPEATGAESSPTETTKTGGLAPVVTEPSQFAPSPAIPGGPASNGGSAPAGTAPAPQGIPPAPLGAEAPLESEGAPANGSSTAGGVRAARAAREASVGAPTWITTAQRVDALGCGLSELGGSVAEYCIAGAASDTQRLLSQAPLGFTNGAAALAATPDAPAGGGHGGSAAAGPPVTPAPGPAPSGASGSAAGSAGIAVSGLLTLAALLLFGAPRAMRRLRLSCQPWRTACFVLIPERPG
jgi:hypothetical protein